MNKIIKILGSVILSSVLLAGCSNTNTNENNVTQSSNENVLVEATKDTKEKEVVALNVGTASTYSSLADMIAEVKESPKATKLLEEKGTRGTLKITMVEPNREQPRKNFDEDKLVELSESIKKHGVITPILVQDRGDHYEIIAGERRWRAARLAGLKEIPAVIGKYTEQEIAEISLIENIQRDDLNPIEEAQAYKKLMDDYKLKQDEVADRVSKSRSTITNSLRLLKLCDRVQQMVIDESISTGHARALLSVDSPETQFELAQRVLDEKLSVRDIEKLVKNIGKPQKEKNPTKKELDVFYKDIAETLKSTLGTKVNVSGKGDGTGKIEIEFYSNSELDRIIAKLK